MDRVLRFRNTVQTKIESMHQRAIPVFDQNYKPFSGSAHPKFTTGYLEAFRQELQSVYDECEREIAGGAYAVAADTNGYIGIHNSRFSKPLTGDPNVDLTGNRTMRKFDNPRELRAARNTEPLLLQVYLRDTGEILCDVAMPIHVAGRHWGNVRVGLNTEILLRSSEHGACAATNAPGRSVAAGTAP